MSPFAKINKVPTEKKVNLEIDFRFLKAFKRFASQSLSGQEKTALFGVLVSNSR